ncbi:MAG: hypothetical protein KKF33_12490, partial [Alphaproteobacteria bacterium]|nr:hypothetical protein [Alphaproteobacteria bacterium]
IDHRVGFDRLAGLSAALDQYNPIARIHAADSDSAADAERRIKAAYGLDGVVPRHPLIADSVPHTTAQEV